MKGDLGALILDIMIANHAKADELSKNVLGIKDLFLFWIGFLSISLSGPLSAATVVSAVIITPLILLKSAFFSPRSPPSSCGRARHSLHGSIRRISASSGSSSQRSVLQKTGSAANG